MLAKISLKFVVLNLLLTSLSKSTNGPPPEAQMSKTQKEREAHKEGDGFN